MILDELLNQANQIRYARARAARGTNVRNLVIGAGVGAAIGIAAGILLAPRPGRETRQIIAERTKEKVKELEKTAVDLCEAGQEAIKAAKMNLEEANEDNKKKSHEQSVDEAVQQEQ